MGLYAGKEGMMPSTSPKMRTAACIAYSVKKGETSVGYIKKRGGAAWDMYNSMTLEQLRDYCKLPIKK